MLIYFHQDKGCNKQHHAREKKGDSLSGDEGQQAECCWKAYVQKCPVLNLSQNWSRCCCKPEWIYGADKSSLGLLVILHSSGRGEGSASCAHSLSRPKLICMSLAKCYRPTVAMVTLQIFCLAQGLVALGFDGEGEQLQVVWPGLYPFPCLWAMTARAALSVSYPSENGCNH